MTIMTLTHRERANHPATLSYSYSYSSVVRSGERMILPVDKLQELFVVYCPTGAGLAAVRWLGFVFCHYMRDERALLHESGIHQLVAEGQLCYLANLPQLSWLNEGCAILCTHTEEAEACTINTHTHKNNGQMCHIGSRPPQPKAGAPCATSGNSGPALDKLLKPGQVLAGALTVPSNYGVGTQSPTWTLME